MARRHGRAPQRENGSNPRKIPRGSRKAAPPELCLPHIRMIRLLRMPHSFKASLAFTVLLAVLADAAELQGLATVIDGDTLEIGGRHVRLFGIDAPETGQTCTRPDGRSSPC